MNLRRARENLLAGRGPGASDAEVAAHTRNRVVIAGESATHRLELAARDTARARRDVSGLTDTIQIASTELADTLTQVTQRLRPEHAASTAVIGAITRVRANPAPFVVVGAILVLLARARRRRGQHRPMN
ncbi:MAG: hypothetical protein ACR2LX_03675 [Jatrophihabitans sp.]